MADQAWFLNLDAEVELGLLHGYTAGHRTQDQVARHLAACAALTLGDPIYGRDVVERQLPVFCWCPTPSAIGTLDGAGLRATRGPDLGVLRRANDRAWTVAFADPAIGRRFVTAADDWRRLLLDQRPATGAWRLKRRFGFAGRGQRRLRAAPSADDLNWIAASLRQGGLLCEAELPVFEEFSIHGYVDPGELLLGSPVSFSTDAFGAPAGHAAPALGCGDLALVLADAATRVASHLVGLGYFGPFGVDAFRWRSKQGLLLNPVSDVNARFTLAWSTGMGQLRERALQRHAAWSAEVSPRSTR
ncbi:MAG TPA: hypothetical protein VI197_10205 [Polyangiaceae bacterium]